MSVEHPHSFIGFSHCLDCAKHAYKELRAENERLKAHAVEWAEEVNILEGHREKLEQRNAELRALAQEALEAMLGDGDEFVISLRRKLKAALNVQG